MKSKFIILSLITAKVLLGESLSVITVDANQDSSSTSVSATKIDRTQIDNSVQGNGFISSLLDTNPNIEVIDDSKRSTTAGEITPGKISINEAPFYQNNFQIDGVSNDSLLDPNLSNTFDPYDVPGNENEIFLDLDLIDSIFVYDSNISAEYGNFTGGVIDAKTIRAGSEPSYKLSVGHTSDKLTKFHVSNNDVFEQARSDNYQPRFEKTFFSMYANTPINDENGLIVSYNRKQSIISGAYFGGFRDKERLNESIFAKWSHYFEDDSVLDISGTYSPYESTHFQEYVRDSDTKVTGGGASLKANYEKEFDFWNFKTNLAFKYSENSRDSINYNKQWIRTNEKNWGEIPDNGEGNSYEGGSGSIDKTQHGLAYNLKLNSDAFETGVIAHTLKTGLDLNYNTSEYNRKNNMYYYNEAILNSAINCNGDNKGCSQNDQYFGHRRVYQAEKATADIISTAFFFEDKLKYENFEITPGIRVDYNDYLENADLSYRLNSTYKPFGDESTVFYGGLNRYYGKSFLGYKLREARAPYYDDYRYSVSGNIVGGWGTSSGKDTGKYVFSGLDTPYTDEASFGIRQDFKGMRLNLKYVNREGKNKFSKEKGENQVFTRPDGLQGYYKPTYFTNGGYSESEIISLSIAPTKPVEFSGFNLGYKLSTSWRETSTNIDDYDDILEDEEQDRPNKVYYNGEYIDRNKLPLESDPKNINLHLNLAFNPIDILGIPTRVKLNNIIRYSLAYSDVFLTDDKLKEPYREPLTENTIKEWTNLDYYKKFDFDDAVTLDLKASFDFKISGKKHLLFNAEVTNVFDKVQHVESSRSNYKTGRQFWFNLAYKF